MLEPRRRRGSLALKRSGTLHRNSVGGHNRIARVPAGDRRRHYVADLMHQHVGAGGVAEKVLSAGLAKRWRRRGTSRMVGEPSGPCGPPGSRRAGRLLDPRVRIEVAIVRGLEKHLEAGARVVRSRDDAGVVAAAREQEGHVSVGEQVDLEHRAPGRDVVALRPDGEDRRADVAERDRPAVDREAALGEIIVEEQPPQIFANACDRACGWRRAFQAIRSFIGARSPMR